MKNEKEIRYFSMFTGVGGFELGLDNSWNNNRSNRESREFKGIHTEYKESKSSFRCIGFSEIDKYSCELLKNKFPGIKNYGDATTINPSELPDFDMLCGGFPCQAFSIAGKRRGFNDTRGTLFFDIARILEVKRPKIMFLENVKGLLNHEQGKTFRKIIQTLSELGYNVQWMVLNSKFFGVPQNRERVFIIGNLRGEPRSEILPFGWNDEPIAKGLQEQHCSQTISTRTGSTAKQQTIIRGRPKMPYEPGKRELNYTTYKDTCPTLSQNCASGDQKNIVMPMIRRLTPIECERLQGFPDNWTEGFSNTQRYKMMGNAVTVNVIRSIAERLQKTSHNTKKPKSI